MWSRQNWSKSSLPDALSDKGLVWFQFWKWSLQKTAMWPSDFLFSSLNKAYYICFIIKQIYQGNEEDVEKMRWQNSHLWKDHLFNILLYFLSALENSRPLEKHDCEYYVNIYVCVIYKFVLFFIWHHDIAFSSLLQILCEHEFQWPCLPTETVLPRVSGASAARLSPPVVGSPASILVSSACRAWLQHGFRAPRPSRRMRSVFSRRRCQTTLTSYLYSSTSSE